MSPAVSHRVALLVLAGLAAACGSDHAPAPTAAESNPLEHCAPLSEAQISATLHADRLTSDLEPPTCVWTAQTPSGATDVTFAFSAQDSLLQLESRARRDGYDTEHVVVTRQALGSTISANGFYARAIRDPGDCAVTAAANGSITWHVRNRSHAAIPDPCKAALDLTSLTIDLAP